MAGLSQAELATALGDHVQSMVAHVEAGRRGLRYDALVKAARELGVSLDYLVGLTDDPTPAVQRTGAAHAVAETGVAYGPGSLISRPLEVLEVAAAAGGGAAVFDETPVGLFWFSSDWLERRSIDPTQAKIIGVQGESMEPTLPDGCSILVDCNRREPRQGRLYVLRTEEGLVVKRLGKDDQGRWQVVSDNPGWPPTLLTYGAEIIGEVQWMARTLY